MIICSYRHRIKSQHSLDSGQSQKSTVPGFTSYNRLQKIEVIRHGSLPFKRISSLFCTFILFVCVYKHIFVSIFILLILRVIYYNFHFSVSIGFLSVNKVSLSASCDFSWAPFLLFVCFDLF